MRPQNKNNYKYQIFYYGNFYTITYMKKLKKDYEENI